MLLQYKDIKIRNATVADADILSKWWNDGKIMAHAGFPYGTGEKSSDIAAMIIRNCDEGSRTLIIEVNEVPIGEMSYHNQGDHIAEIGIKICDISKQNKGYGKIILSMFINSLFNDYKFEKLILDTNLKNERAQHVYEALGFKKVRVNKAAFKNQLGEMQTAIDYEMKQNDFHEFR